jgi:signal transduction histidine kinase
VQQPAVAVHFIKSGASDVLVYPFLPEELHCRVNRLLDQIEHYHQLVELNHQKNHLMGMAAHDIRGPVSNMGAACRMLRSPNLKPERRADLLDMMERASTDLLGRLNDLLDLSAIESGQLKVQPAPMDLRELLRQRVDFFMEAAEQKDLRLDIHLPLAPLVMGDSARLGQVIDNLLSNAIKFSHRGGCVQVRLANGEGQALVRVIDTGIGIAEQEADRLFRAFSRTSSRPTGGESTTGLGLAICHNIIRQHGGEIWLESGGEGGCTFCFSVPLA